MRTVHSSRGLSLLFLFIIPFSRAFNPSSWSHRHMFKRAYGVDTPLAAVQKVHSTALSPTATPPFLSIPPIVPSIPFQPLPFPTTTAGTPTTSPDTTSTPSTSSTSTTSSSISSSTSSPTTSPTTTSSVVQSTSSTPPPIVEQASPTAGPTTLVAAPSPVYTSPDAFTSALPPSPTPTQSSSGFLSNSGAVAGTFTVVGLFGIAGIIGVGMLIARRRRSRRKDEDMEYLDNTPDLPGDPPTKERGGFYMEDSMTEDGHYGTPPMVVSSPPIAYYPDHAYPTQPRGYPIEAYASQGYNQGFPVGYVSQHIYRPEDYNIAYPPQATYPDTSMPNPHSFADVELGSTPVSSTQATTSPVPDALRPAVQSTSVAPQRRVDSRFSVDSFYTGMATEKYPSTGQAL